MNSKTNWVLEIDPVIFKELKRIPRKDAERILFVIKNLSLNPFGGDIQKMKGEENVWRRRVVYGAVESALIVLSFKLETRIKLFTSIR